MLGTAGVGEDPDVWGQELRLGVDPGGGVNWDAFPLTFDYTDSASNDQFGTPQFGRTLHDLVSGQEYRLRRLVGKVQVGFTPTLTSENAENIGGCQYAAGFIVCKTDDDGNPTTDFDEVNPFAQNSTDDPWIWRRKWILGSQGIAENVWVNPATVYSSLDQLIFKNFPPTTVHYGSVADGPHIDQKTARVISRQERLFFVHATRIAAIEDTTYVNEGFIRGYLDLRILASLRSGMGNRRNASR